MHEAAKDEEGQPARGRGLPAGNLAPGVRFQDILL